MASASGLPTGRPGRPLGRHDRHTIERVARGIKRGDGLHDHAAHRGADHVRLVEAQRIEQGRSRRPPCVLHPGRGASTFLAAHHLLEGIGRCWARPHEPKSVERPVVAVCRSGRRRSRALARPWKKASGQMVSCAPQAHDQQQGRIALVARRLVFDLDAVGLLRASRALQFALSPDVSGPRQSCHPRAQRGTL